METFAYKFADMPRTKVAQKTAAEWVPRSPTLTSLKKASASCKACDLWRLGTQTVFGEGPRNARVILVGEQPGNEEDLSGRPFVGPAGKLLDKALAEAGIDRDLTYVTNVVKHFKWIPRGEKRIHDKPSAAEVSACIPWLEWELALIKPEVLICLGATAAQAVLGKQFRVTIQRGKFVSSPLAPKVMATVHPSSILRARDEETRRREKQHFIQDLKVAVPYIQALHPAR